MHFITPPAVTGEAAPSSTFLQSARGKISGFARYLAPGPRTLRYREDFSFTRSVLQVDRQDSRHSLDAVRFVDELTVRVKPP